MHVTTSREPQPDRAPERRREPPALAADALLRLQRAAGNQAVTRMVQRSRTEQVPAAALPHGSDASLFVKQVTDGTPNGAPKKLGQTDPPTRGMLQLPEVWTEPVDGGVVLKVSEAADLELFWSVSVAPGVIKSKPNVDVTLLEEYARVDDNEFPPGAVKLAEEVKDLGGGTRTEAGMTVSYVVSPEEAGLIRDNEQQHPDDIAEAFKISAAHVADIAAALTGIVFPDKATALRTVVDQLDKRLVPETPMVREAWSRHLFTVLDTLYSLSAQRDVRKEHDPRGRHGTLDLAGRTLTMSPVMGRPGGRTPAALVTLANAGLEPVTPRYDVEVDTAPPIVAPQAPAPAGPAPAAAALQPLPPGAAKGLSVRLLEVQDVVRFFDDADSARSGAGDVAQEDPAHFFSEDLLKLEESIGDAWLVSKTDKYGSVYAVVPARLLGV